MEDHISWLVEARWFMIETRRSIELCTARDCKGKSSAMGKYLCQQINPTIEMREKGDPLHL